MRTLICVIVAFAFLVSCSGNLSGPKPALGGQKHSKILIEEVLTQVQDALNAVNDEITSDPEDAEHPYAGFPRLGSVTVKLSTVVGKEASGGFNFYVVSFGAKRSIEETQTVTLKLVPPEAGARRASSSVSEALANAIIAAAKGVQNARGRKPSLHLQELKSEIKFVVKTSGEGGLKFEIAPVGIEMGGKASLASTHHIILEFK